MKPHPIPAPVIAVVSKTLSEYGSHTKIDRWLRLAAVPEGTAVGSNKEQKVMYALDALNALQPARAIEALGTILCDLMESTVVSDLVTGFQTAVSDALKQHGLRYSLGGSIVQQGQVIVAQSLEDAIRVRNWTSVETEYRRAYEGIREDPPKAITAACAILESLCKVYIETQGLEMPNKSILQDLWPIVQKNLGLDPASKEDDDLKKILGGLSSATVGIAHLRTHIGSAHGKGLKPYRVLPRHAHLAVGAAHTLAIFLIETWDARITAS